MPRLRFALPLAVLILIALSGCSTLLRGAGEVGLGYSSTSRVFAYHTVDGDKQNATSESKIDLDTLIELLYQNSRRGAADGNDTPVEAPDVP